MVGPSVVFLFGFILTVGAAAGFILVEDTEAFKAVIGLYQLPMFLVLLAASVIIGFPVFESILGFIVVFLSTQLATVLLIGFAYVWPRIVYSVRLRRPKRK